MRNFQCSLVGSEVSEPTTPIQPRDILIAMYGQSNTVGQSTPDLPPNEYKEPENSFSVGSFYNGTPTLSFAPLKYTVSNFGNTFGDELSMCKSLGGGYICKIGKDGSSIQGLTKVANDVYPQMLTLMQSALAQKEFKKIVLRYNQWEGDSLTSTVDYVTRFKSIITDFETDTGTAIDLIIVTKARATGGDAYTYIITAQNELAIFYGDRFVMLDCDDIPRKDDFHYTGAGYITIGERVATSIISKFNIA